MKQGDQVKWLRLAVSLIVLVGLSFGLAYFLEGLRARLDLPLDELGWVAYLTVFMTTLVCNLTVIAPIPIATAIMIAAATRWNPIAVSFFASVGGALGELSGYYAGYLGKRIAIAEEATLYRRISGWMQRYGLWAIVFLAFQPVLPFDIGGLLAGASRMPPDRFLLAVWVGKFPKYLIFSYSGMGVIRFLPFWAE